MNYGFYFDMTNCIGCRACQIACKDKNDLQVGKLFRRVETYENGSYPKPGYYHLSRSCNHCASPACVANCPTGAMYKDEETGVVMHSDEECIGCQSCVNSCPYEVPQYFEDRNITGKCDMCKNLRDVGSNPACVDACPMRAIEWGDADELAAKHATAVRDIAVLPESSRTEPSFCIEAKQAAKEADAERKFV